MEDLECFAVREMAKYGDALAKIERLTAWAE